MKISEASTLEAKALEETEEALRDELLDEAEEMKDEALEALSEA